VPDADEGVYAKPNPVVRRDCDLKCFATTVVVVPDVVHPDCIQFVTVREPDFQTIRTSLYAGATATDNDMSPRWTCKRGLTALLTEAR